MDFERELERYNERHPDARVESRSRPSGDFVLALGGELDMKSSTDMTPLLEAAMGKCPPHGSLFLDMSRVTYVSSTGVGLIATAMVSTEKLSLKLVLLNIPARVCAIMNTLGLLSFQRGGIP